MRPFALHRAHDLADAVAALGPAAEHQPIAGGTNLLDLMKADVMRPTRLVDITRLPMRTIEDTADGGLRLGALVSNAETARDPRVVARYPLVARAILAGASPQIRNMATDGGNLLQRTRCYYFYDTATACNKRAPGSGCSALDGVNRIHAILGATEHCIAVHPSDMCVALAALGAAIRVDGPGGERVIAIADLHRLPGDRPERDTTLEPGEIVTAIDLPPDGFAEHCTYLKVRDRASFAFALVSVAAAVHLDGDVIREARLALGGVAAKPWRVAEAEALLAGRPATRDHFGRAAEVVLQGAVGRGHNTFKIELARRAIVRALDEACGGAP